MRGNRRGRMKIEKMKLLIDRERNFIRKEESKWKRIEIFYWTKKIKFKRKINAKSIAEFIETLEVSEDIKNELKAITPQNYTGI